MSASQYTSPIKKIAPARPTVGLESIRAKTIPPGEYGQAPSPVNERRSSPGDLGDFPNRQDRTASPTGTLMKNTHRQGHVVAILPEQDRLLR
jgi:hypothetical protein